jgi:hypothetical protein
MMIGELRKGMGMIYDALLSILLLFEEFPLSRKNEKI